MEARLHLAFAAKLYKIQMEEGRMFLHEHPESAASWKEECMLEVMAMPGVLEVKSDMCAYGMKLRECKENELVKKPTRFITNAPQIAVELE